jgi:hypothetical protein
MGNWDNVTTSFDRRWGVHNNPAKQSNTISHVSDLELVVRPDGVKSKIDLKPFEHVGDGTEVPISKGSKEWSE